MIAIGLMPDCVQPISYLYRHLFWCYAGMFENSSCRACAHVNLIGKDYQFHKPDQLFNSGSGPLWCCQTKQTEVVMHNRTSTESLQNALQVLLANVHRLALQARFHHWNVTGMWFDNLHARFGALYAALSETEDALAERLRALALDAPYCVSALTQPCTLQLVEQKQDARQMVADLLSGYRQLQQNAKVVGKSAQENGDEVTNDMMVELLAEWEKQAWMLSVHLH